MRFTGPATGLDALKIEHDVQHSQRALPALDKGSNKITFSAGPAEGTITLEGATSDRARGKQLILSDFAAKAEGLEFNPLRLAGGKGQLTFPVVTPGDLVRLRFGGHYRAARRSRRLGPPRLLRRRQDVQEGGPLRRATPGSCRYATFADVPPGTRKALVRFAGNQRNTTCLFDFRIDADYREPNGGFRPLRVVYRWEEDGRPKEDVHVVRKDRETYTITCAGKPLMKSVSLGWED